MNFQRKTFLIFSEWVFTVWYLVFLRYTIIINQKVLFSCSPKSSKESKKLFQIKKLEMLNYIKDSLERKTASVNASIEVLERQIERDKED